MIKLDYPGSLHNHTDYSNFRLKDSINKVEDLMDYAIKLGHKVIAYTEHETVSNAIKIEEAYEIRKQEYPDFKVIRGNEIYLTRDGLNQENFVTGEDKYFHFILLAKDAEGHKQLRELSTRAWLRSYTSKGLKRVPTYYQDLKDIISENQGHIIGSTACLGGYVPTTILKYRDTQNIEYKNQVNNWLKSMKKLFGENHFYLEMQPSNNPDQKYVNQSLIALSKQLDIPYIITCDAHYQSKEDKPIHAAYLHSQDGEREVAEFYDTTYLMGTEELESYFSYFTQEQLQEAYKNINNIAEMCEDYSLKKPLRIPELIWKDSYISVEDVKKYVPQIPNLELLLNSDYKGDILLAKLIIQGIEEKEGLKNQKCYDELNVEIQSIWDSSNVNKAHWSAYFLNLQKMIDICWEAGSLVLAGRGSGVGFLILYILGITQINPLREKTQTFSWRFLNPERVSVLDVDFDISGLRRGKVLRKFREVYGENRVANVLTIGTEKSKSAILSAARGLNIDNDTAQYICSLIPSDRGITRTLNQCYYGDKENGYKPIAEFKKVMEDYPQLWQVAQKIEGVICRIGIHAGGLIVVDEDFTETSGLMTAPDGTVITQFDLHDAEKMSLIKVDALSVEAADKIQVCLELLCKYGYIKEYPTLRETYEHAIGIYNIEREDLEMWKMVWEHKIQSLFQMEKPSGVQGIELTHPASVDDLATLNSIIRLMAQEKGGEQPLNKYARFKNDISLWYKEMKDYGLTKEEQELLKDVLGISYGMCESQERFMQLVQIPECGGFDLNFADSLRKAIAKKAPEQFKKLEKQYFDTVKEKDLSKKLCEYVWYVCVYTSRGYG